MSGQMVGIRRMTKSLNNISARDVMTTPAAYVMDQTPIQEVARLLLREGISAAPVLNEGGHLVGIVSEGDLVRRRSGLSNDRRSWWLGFVKCTFYAPVTVASWAEIIRVSKRHLRPDFSLRLFNLTTRAPGDRQGVRSASLLQ